ncbi:histidine kinase [Microbacterium sp. ZXX196]|uniref:histidine kinase n=1 Tax=Microbacterium sp. ZXX196 TaxID=2609291 RepID=UPI0012B8BD4C|nr:histidine kinase [Microbacterium sp. ZXX196]MTE22784.1 histidine kinase [Microbacterium sp. ZXX196]
MSSPSLARGRATYVAVGLLALEALALAVVTGWQVVWAASTPVAAMPTAIALIVLSALGAFAIASFATGVWRGRSWGRSGGIVVQVLIFAIAVGSVTGAYAHWGIAALFAAPAIVGFVALLGSAREAHPSTPSD